MPKLPVLAALLAPGALVAQALPHYVPINPVLASRSAIYAQPVIPAGDGWRTSITMDYSNAIETGLTSNRREYLFDAELMHVDLWLTRDLGPEWFATGNLALRSAHDGFLDSFLNWYHELIQLPVPARNRRPIDTYGWTGTLPNGQAFDIARPAPFAGDLRLGVGRRLGAGQVVASVTLPTATSSVDEWSRNTIGTTASASFRVLSNSRVLLELGANVGYTPTHGELAEYQRTFFVGATTGFRWRVIRQQAVFATLLVQSANYQNTGFAALDDPEVTLDFGGLLQLKEGWPALQVGMTEDLLPRGPSVDAGFRLGLHW
jgi:hypothetical protein